MAGGMKFLVWHCDAYLGISLAYLFPAADTIQVGSVRTRSSDTYVTDSAAAATAYSCGIKVGGEISLVGTLLIRNPAQTYNGGIAVDEDGNPCGTVLEAAHFAGYKTGLVATSRITVSHPCLVAYPLLTALSTPLQPPLPRTSTTVIRSGPLRSSSSVTPLLDLL